MIREMNPLEALRFWLSGGLGALLERLARVSTDYPMHASVQCTAFLPSSHQLSRTFLDRCEGYATLAS